MHKIIPKERYIAASNKCTTKPISQIITKCLKLVTSQHRKLCNAIYKYTGVNRMWIIDNTSDILDTIDQYNDDSNTDVARNIRTYDFSTLYTNIPHEDLKQKLKWVVEKAFFTKHYIFVDDYGASWGKRYNAHKLDKNELLEYINFLIDNIYVTVGNDVFRQVIGIPMGTDCAPFLANLYLYALEFEFLEKLTKQDIRLARKFSKTFRYIDDLSMFNSDGLMDTYKTQIYPLLILNNENKSDLKATILDLDLTIVNNHIISKIYDKRDDFNFDITVFPNLSGNVHYKRSHGVIISQLIRYTKACTNVQDFIYRSKTMIHTLYKQFFNKDMLKDKFSTFYDKHYHLIKKYEMTKLTLMSNIFTRTNP